MCTQSPGKPKNQIEQISPFYQRWLDEDVRWIITDEERSAFGKLVDDRERDLFIEQFWRRRDPTPGTPENEYKEEHYGRIVYANEHFAGAMPGWKTDRGRMYIMYGAPDSIDAHPTGVPNQRAPEEGGSSTGTYPFEVWHYRYLEGIGSDVEVEFVDLCRCGDYRMTVDQKKEDAFVLPTHQTSAIAQNPSSSKDKATTLAYVGGVAAPRIKFKDLEEIANHKLNVHTLPFDVRVDFVKATADTSLMPITIQLPNRELTFANKEGVSHARIDLFGRMVALNGRIVERFEDTLRLDVPEEYLSKVRDNVALYWKALDMHPGHYRLELVVKDVNGDRVGSFEREITIPDYGAAGLAASTLIVADVLQPVPTKQRGTGNFVIGINKVRPKVPPGDGSPVRFKPDQRINFWMQVYNLGIDAKTHKPSATVEYIVVNEATKKASVDFNESIEQMENAGEQVTVQKSLPAAKLEPGEYQITIKIADRVSGNNIAQTATFQVE